MNIYLSIFLVIFIILLIFFFLPFARKRNIILIQERKEDHVPGGEEEYNRILKEGKKYREEWKRKNERT